MNGLNITQLVTFNIILLAALLSPGAAFLYITKVSASDGRAAGILSGLGLGFAAATWTFLGLLGLQRVLLHFPELLFAIRVLGALYLLYLAVSIWNEKKETHRFGSIKKRNYFVTGLLINFSNPKSVLFVMPLVPLVFSSGINFMHILVIPANQFALEVLCYILFASLFSLASIRGLYLEKRIILNRLFSVILTAFSISLLM